MRLTQMNLSVLVKLKHRMVKSEVRQHKNATYTRYSVNGKDVTHHIGRLLKAGEINRLELKEWTHGTHSTD